MGLSVLPLITSLLISVDIDELHIDEIVCMLFKMLDFFFVAVVKHDVFGDKIGFIYHKILFVAINSMVRGLIYLFILFLVLLI